MKCGKVKNPCKVCFQTVNNKNGLQCKGACKKWAHYKCLNFTPGKISDVKAGVIKITCPCPGCTTSEPKELLTNPPYICTNQQCPASKLPSCESTNCPTKQHPIPEFQPVQTTSRSESPKSEEQSPQECIPLPTQITVPKCLTPPKIPSPIRKTSLSKIPPSPPYRYTSPPRKPTSPPRRPGSPPKCKRTCKPPCPSCPVHCPKRQQNNVADKQCSPQKSQSCSFISTEASTGSDTGCEPPRAFSSHAGLLYSQQDQKMLYNTVEDMCNTVGQLSNQLKDLMCKMTNAFENSYRNSN